MSSCMKQRVSQRVPVNTPPQKTYLGSTTSLNSFFSSFRSRHAQSSTRRNLRRFPLPILLFVRRRFSIEMTLFKLTFELVVLGGVGALLVVVRRSGVSRRSSGVGRRGRLLRSLGGGRVLELALKLFSLLLVVTRLQVVSSSSVSGCSCSSSDSSSDGGSFEPRMLVLLFIERLLLGDRVAGGGIESGSGLALVVSGRRSGSRSESRRRVRLVDGRSDGCS